MISFSKVFKELFHVKNRVVHMIVLLNAVASIILTLIMLTSSNGGKGQISTGSRAYEIGNFGGFILVLAGVMAMMIFFTSAFYFIWSSVANEKIGRQQTWQLLPISSSKFYLANILSSLVSYIYMGLLQVAIIALDLLFGIMVSDGIRKWVNYIFSGTELSNVDVAEIAQGLILGALIVLLSTILWYLLIGIYHYLTRAAIEFMPFAGNKFITFLIRVVLLVAFIYALSMISDASRIIFDPSRAQAFDTMYLANLQLLILDIVFGSLNIFLYSRFVEAK